MDADYTLARVNNQSIYASRGNQGAFVKLFMDEMNAAIQALHQKRCVALFADNDNSCGVVKGRSPKGCLLYTSPSPRD